VIDARFLAVGLLARTAGQGVSPVTMAIAFRVNRPQKMRRNL
jgi:hypothetical protein